MKNIKHASGYSFNPAEVLSHKTFAEWMKWAKGKFFETNEDAQLKEVWAACGGELPAEKPGK